jgi:hypothetical protein
LDFVVILWVRRRSPSWTASIAGRVGGRPKASEGKIGGWADNLDEISKWAQQLSIDRYANTA